MKGKKITSLTNKKTMTITLISILILSAIIVVMVQAAPLTGVTATPTDPDAGASTTYTIAFTTATALTVAAPADQILITFPSGFDASLAAVDATTTTPVVDSDPTLVTATETLVTLDVTDNHVAGAFSIVLTGIVNIQTPGSYTVVVETEDGAAVTIDGPTTSGTFDIDPAVLDHFTMTGYPATCILSIPWITPVDDVVVTAYDEYGNVKTDYLGTVIWTSTDPGGISLPANYPFVGGDAGVHTFPGTDFTLVTPGSQTITVTDGSVSLESASILVKEVIELDEAYYKTGENPIIIVEDPSANLRPLVIDTVEVIASSDIPDQITVTLTETGVSTGIFDGTFTLVSAAPGPNDLLVVDGSEITVSYDNPPYVDDHVVYVDDTSPEVTIIEPLEGVAISEQSPDISATVSDAHSELASAMMELDGEVVAMETYLPPEPSDTLSYSVPSFAPLDEGVHTVKVTASDVAGNVATKIWSFNVELTKPTVTVVVDPDPAKADTVEFTLTFSKLMNTGVHPTVTFGLTTPFTSHPVAETSFVDRVWIGTATISAGWDGLNTISVSGAKDLAGNEMVTDTSNTFTIDTVPPTTPADLTAVDTDVSVTLTWTASTDIGTGVESYDVYRDGSLIDSVDHPTTTYTDYGPLVDTTYDYYVKAVDYAANFADSSVVPVDFTPGDVIAYPVDLVEDWNLISLPMMPEDSDIEVVLADVMAGVEIVWSFDAGTWYRYLPGQPLFSTLTDMEDGKGYWIKMAGEDSLIAYGTVLPEPPLLPPVYPVYVDWNLIGFKSIDAMDITDYFTTIPETTLSTAVCYRYDASAQAYELVYLGGELDPLIQFEPGQGYWLYLVEEANIAPP